MGVDSQQLGRQLSIERGFSCSPVKVRKASSHPTIKRVFETMQNDLNAPRQFAMGRPGMADRLQSKPINVVLDRCEWEDVIKLGQPEVGVRAQSNVDHSDKLCQDRDGGSGDVDGSGVANQ